MDDSYGVQNKVTVMMNKFSKTLPKKVEKLAKVSSTVYHSSSFYHLVFFIDCSVEYSRLREVTQRQTMYAGAISNTRRREANAASWRTSVASESVEWRQSRESTTHHASDGSLSSGWFHHERFSFCQRRNSNKHSFQGSPRADQLSHPVSFTRVSESKAREDLRGICTTNFTTVNIEDFDSGMFR